MSQRHPLCSLLRFLLRIPIPGCLCWPQTFKELSAFTLLVSTPLSRGKRVQKYYLFPYPQCFFFNIFQFYCISLIIRIIFLQFFDKIHQKKSKSCLFSSKMAFFALYPQRRKRQNTSFLKDKFQHLLSGFSVHLFYIYKDDDFFPKAISKLPQKRYFCRK